LTRGPVDDLIPGEVAERNHFTSDEMHLISSDLGSPSHRILFVSLQGSSWGSEKEISL
jgi:hypothetical protein